MLRFDLPAVRANVVRWEAFLVFLCCLLAFVAWPALLVLPALQGLVHGFAGHQRSPLHRRWTRLFESRGWAGARENVGPKMFAAKILFFASTVALALLAAGSPLWRIACALLVVFSFMEWALGFCAACWAYALWHRAR